MRELDDALSMVYLFARMPSIVKKIPQDVPARCERYCKEWEYYVIKSNALRKVFVSIKGIYYQAEISGQQITWLTPHNYVIDAVCFIC